jgi:hypothetical protein
MSSEEPNNHPCKTPGEAAFTTTAEFLTECEAKATEARTVAAAATPGPWRAYYQKEGRFMGNRVAVDSTRDDPDSWACAVVSEPNRRFMNVEDWNKPDLEFVAHARASNPDLADRVIALVKMVRERDEKIGELSATVESLSLALQWDNEP